MKHNGMKLNSRGRERVYICGDRYNKTVWQVDGQWKFYTRLNGEFIEVYHKNMYFSTTP